VAISVIPLVPNALWQALFFEFYHRKNRPGFRTATAMASAPPESPDWDNPSVPYPNLQPELQLELQLELQPELVQLEKLELQLAAGKSHPSHS
jgi:hypothetical protein